MIELTNPFCNAASYSACLGVDWGHSVNCFSLLAAGGSEVEYFEVQADPSSTLKFVSTLRSRFPEGSIAIVSEQAKGALTSLLLDFDFIELFSINPHASAEFRKSLHPSGSKSDSIDSMSLLRMIFSHRDRMRTVRRMDEQSRRLEELSRHRRAIVDQRVEVSNRLTSLLRDYYPQALPMLGENPWDPISRAFLRRWPCYSKLASSSDPVVEKFYYAHGSRSQAAIQKRLDHRCSCSPVSSDPLLEELGSLRMLDLVEQLGMLSK